MKKAASILLVFAFWLISADIVFAQKRPPRQRDSNVQTRENAQSRKKANKNEKEAEYVMRKGHHQEIQDKGTRKRMKKNLRKAQKQAQGREIPWYKRLFRKRRF